MVIHSIKNRTPTPPPTQPTLGGGKPPIWGPTAVALEDGGLEPEKRPDAKVLASSQLPRGFRTESSQKGFRLATRNLSRPLAAHSYSVYLEILSRPLEAATYSFKRGELGICTNVFRIKELLDCKQEICGSIVFFPSGLPRINESGSTLLLTAKNRGGGLFSGARIDIAGLNQCQSDDERIRLARALIEPTHIFVPDDNCNSDIQLGGKLIHPTIVEIKHLSWFNRMRIPIKVQDRFIGPGSIVR